MKIDILVPLYNKEDYIERCIQSILDQTYKNFQVIILDDGSTDNSIKLAKKFTKDSRIKVVSQSNIGLGETRNRLVNLSKGDFLLHLDADDYLKYNCLELMVEKQIENNADLVFSDFNIIGEKGLKGKIKRRNFNDNSLLRKYYFSALGYNSVCNILISRKLYEQNITVPGINYGEDWSVIYQLVYYAKTYNHTMECTYNYYHNKSSMTFSVLTDENIASNIKDVLKLYDKYVEFIKEKEAVEITNIEKESFKLEVSNSVFSILIRNRKPIEFLEENEINLPLFNVQKLMKLDLLLPRRLVRLIILRMKKIIILFNGLRS